MSLRPTTAFGLLCELIAKDNPSLKIPIAEDNIGVRKGPTSISLANFGRNTKITLTGKPGMGYKGDVEVTYDRLSLNYLFNGISPVLKVPGGKWKQRDLIPFIVDQLGILIRPEDFSQAWLDTEVNITAAIKAVAVTPSMSLSYCYVGGVSVRVIAGAKAYYPDSGPGSKGLLFGDTDEGYFGEVSSAELMSGSELIRLIWNNVNNPSVSVDDVVWGKFFWRGSVIYFAWRGIANTYWKVLYDKGAATGERGSGDIPASWTPVNQDLLVTKRISGVPFSFRVRLPKIAEKYIQPGLSVPEATSEIIRLTRRCASQAWNGTGEWYDDTTNHGLGLMLAANRRVAIAEESYTTYHTGQSVSTFPTNGLYTWYPVLEYVDPTKEVVPLGEVVGSVLSSKPIVPVDSWSTYIAGLVLSDAPEIDFGPKPIPSSAIIQTTIAGLIVSNDAPQQFTPFPVVAVDISSAALSRITWSDISPHYVDPKPIPATAIVANDPSKRIDLSKLNNELDGF